MNLSYHRRDNEGVIIIAGCKEVVELDHHAADSPLPNHQSHLALGDRITKVTVPFPNFMDEAAS